MDPEGGVRNNVVRADLVCHGHNSTHNTLATPLWLLLRCFPVQRVLASITDL